MRFDILIALGALCSLYACSKQPISISALCEKGQKGSYVLKWEVFPDIDSATIEIFASDNDLVFPSQPIKRTNADKFIAIIENADSLNYSFFRLKIGNTYSDVIKNRLHEFDEVQNFRDVGGYKTNDGRMVKWNKIFRSGEFSQLSEKDKEKVKSLKLKSVIDLRSTETQNRRQDIVEIPNRYEIYITGTSNDSISEQVIGNRFLRGDAIIYMQDMYEEMFISHSEEYAKFFDYLTDENNYPLVYHCSLGKDQSGIATYFLLRALDVPSEVIEDDYMFSNIGIDKSKIIKDASVMSDSQQQAFTMLTRTDASYLRYGLACAKKEDGSIDDFMTNKLRLTKEKRQRLRELLLY